MPPVQESSPEKPVQEEESDTENGEGQDSGSESGEQSPTGLQSNARKARKGRRRGNMNNVRTYVYRLLKRQCGRDQRIHSEVVTRLSGDLEKSIKFLGHATSRIANVRANTGSKSTATVVQAGDVECAWEVLRNEPSLQR